MILMLVVAAACDEKQVPAFQPPGGSAAGSAVTPAAGSAVTPGAGSAAPTPVPTKAAVAAGSGSDTAKAADPFAVGAKVSALWSDGAWYDAKITKVNDDGTYRITYYDGTVTRSQAATKLRVRKASTGTASSGRGTCVSWSGDQCVRWSGDAACVAWSGNDCVRRKNTRECVSWSGNECVRRRGDPVCTSWSGNDCVAW